MFNVYIRSPSRLLLVNWRTTDHDENNNKKTAGTHVHRTNAICMALHYKQWLAGWPLTITPQGTRYHSVTILPLALWFSYFDNRP